MVLKDSNFYKVIIGVVLLFVVTHGLDKLIGPDEKKLKKEGLLAAFPVLAKSYKISFDLKPNSYSYGFHNVIHFVVGNDFSRYRNSTPALSFYEDKYNSEGFYIATPINGNPNRGIYTDALPLNEWTNVVISQQRNNSKYIFTIDLNGTNVFTERNNKPQKFNNVKVFASDPWYPSHDGSIKNLIIENGELGESYAKALWTHYYVDNSDYNIVRLKRNNLVASLSTLEKAFYVSLDLKLDSFSDGYRSVIHLTMGGNDLMYGDRIPGVWIFNKRLHVAFALKGHETFKSKPLFLDEWINVKIEQTVESGKAYFKIFINHNKVYEVQNYNARVFTNIDVYAGDPWYEAQHGLIKNFDVWNT
ncbi:uncharacterized protein LOC124818004 isoform X1 [Hydra vulgaris]|uniref:uncharacterized protein LOC124818004 isoform X1 n=1 Tax=Hydra vulgaris TaxID=6087 RepID=UPI0032E9FD97